MNLLNITGHIQTTVGQIPQVPTQLALKDYWGAVKVRWGIKRNSYRIAPGLYAVGNPKKSSDVFVTANYKLSFDHLRKNLNGINAWILVIDTKGVNVWCAAGKGTFGTDELVKRIQLVNLHAVVDHRRIIVPQLGAVGIAAHEVKKGTNKQLQKLPLTNEKIDFSQVTLNVEKGFHVVYGPVKASDIPEFVKNEYKATPEMREIRFGLWDRIKLIPNDFAYGRTYLFYGALILLFISFIGNWKTQVSQVFILWFTSLISLITAYISGIVITPLFLPFIPFKRFAYKGLAVSVFTTFILLYFGLLGQTTVEKVSWFLINMSIASFMAMNFTGSSTYTSLSGVKKEMRLTIPIQLSSLILGLALLIFSKIKI